ncbi:hypothetical protein Peur_027458 [Populus x canadensis]
MHGPVRHHRSIPIAFPHIRGWTGKFVWLWSISFWYKFWWDYKLGSSLPQCGRTLALLYQLEGITDGSKKMKDLVGRIEAFGGPKEVGEAVVRTITGPHPDMKGTLTKSSLREDSIKAGSQIHFKAASPGALSNVLTEEHEVILCAIGFKSTQAILHYCGNKLKLLFILNSSAGSVKKRRKTLRPEELEFQDHLLKRVNSLQFNINQTEMT